MAEKTSKTLSRRKTDSLFTFWSDEPEGIAADIPAREKICRYILQRICDGTYLPGSHINENRISKKLKISNIPVREAVERLIHIGLIERIPYKGLFIKQLSLKEYQEIYQARQLLEIPLVRELAKTITDQQLTQLREPIKIITEKEETKYNEAFLFFNDPSIQSAASSNAPAGINNTKYYQWLRADIQFHMLMIRFTGNVTLEKIAEMLIPKAILLYRLYHKLFEDKRLQAVFREKLKEHEHEHEMKFISHEQMYQALEKHDADLMEQKMREHLDTTFYLNNIKLQILNNISVLSCYSDVKYLMDEDDADLNAFMTSSP